MSAVEIRPIEEEIRDARISGMIERAVEEGKKVVLKKASRVVLKKLF